MRDLNDIQTAPPAAVDRISVAPGVTLTLRQIRILIAGHVAALGPQEEFMRECLGLQDTDEYHYELDAAERAFDLAFEKALAMMYRPRPSEAAPVRILAQQQEVA